MDGKLGKEDGKNRCWWGQRVQKGRPFSLGLGTPHTDTAPGVPFKLYHPAQSQAHRPCSTYRWMNSSEWPRLITMHYGDPARQSCRHSLKPRTTWTVTYLFLLWTVLGALFMVVLNCVSLSEPQAVRSALAFPSTLGIFLLKAQGTLQMRTYFPPWLSESLRPGYLK